MNRKTSPVYIAVFLYRFAFLLIAVPLQAVFFRGLAPQTAVYIYRTDIALIFIITLWAVISHRHIFFCTDKRTLLTRKGLIISQKNKIFTATFDTLSLSQGLIFRLLKVCKSEVQASHSKTSLYLSTKDSFRLLQNFTDETSDSKEPLHRSSAFSAFVFSIGFSGALTGLLSAIPLLRNIAGIIGENQTQNLLASADLWYYAGYTALPPFLRTLSTLFLIFWAVGALAEFCRFYNLQTKIRKDHIITCHGLIGKHCNVLRKEAISALCFRQSIFFALLGVFTAEVYIPSAGRENKLPLLLASRKNKCKASLSSLYFPQKRKPTFNLTPPSNTLWGYVWKPFLFLLFFCVLCIGTDSLSLYKTEIHLAMFFVTWGISWFVFCAVSHRYSELCCEESWLIIRTSKALSFIEVHIPEEKIRVVKITQSIFQKRKGVCNLRVYVRSRSRQSFLIRHIDKNKTAQLTNL